jgi:hypothetical protein
VQAVPFGVLEAQAHWPAEHTSPLLHVVPHCPQLFTSV